MTVDNDGDKGVAEFEDNKKKEHIRARYKKIDILR